MSELPPTNGSSGTSVILLENIALVKRLAAWEGLSGQELKDENQFEKELPKDDVDTSTKP
jgi:hypothetical protein